MGRLILPPLLKTILMPSKNHPRSQIAIHFPRALVCAGFLLLLSGTASAVELVVDDFNDGLKNQNSLGGFTGSFNDGATSAACVENLSEGGMALTFHREGIGESFTGFFSQLGAGSGTVDLAALDLNQFSFKVRGDIVDGVVGAGQNFQVEIKDDLGHVLKTPLTNVPGFETGAPGGVLLDVSIPFSAMRAYEGALDLTRAREVVIVFNQEFTEPNVSGTSQILIDDLKFTHRENPPEHILDPNAVNPDLDLIGGEAGFGVNFFSGPSARHILTVAEDTQSLRGSALKLYNDLSESGDFFSFLAFVPTQPIHLASSGIRTVKFRARKTGVNSGPTRAVLEIKQGGAVRGTVLTYEIGQGANDAQYAETIFPIYSESATVEEVVLVVFDGGRGTFLVDELSLSTDAYVPNNPDLPPSAGPALSDEELIDYVESQAARYFVNEVVGNSFHVRDRSTAGSSSSMAATGFGLSALTIISERFDPVPGNRWHILSNNSTPLTPQEAESRVRAILNEFLTIQSLQPNLQTGQGDPDRQYGIAGFFYHFLDEDGTRAGGSEVSVIDTAIFLTAALQAGEYFGGDIRDKALQLLNNVNWNFMFLDSEKAFRLSWQPMMQRGFSVADPSAIGFLSDGTIGRPTDELVMLNMLALASDPANTAFQQALYSYPRVERVYHSPSGEDFPVVNSFFGSAFTYLYAHLFYDFESLGQDRPDLIAVDLEFPTPVHWWTNSVTAFRANRQFSIDRSEFFPFSFHANSWGLSAVERPDGRYEGLYGGSPAENGPTHDGTAAPHISFSALPFFKTSDSENPADNIAFQAVRFAYDHMFNDLFGSYGPLDSYNDKAEFSGIFLGLDQGPIVLALENYRSRLIWETFMQNAQIKQASNIAFGHVPQFMPVSDQTVTAGESLSFMVSATDADGDSGIVISSTNLPAGAQLTNNGVGSASFLWTPTTGDVGSRVVAFHVRDAFRENPDPLFVMITVEPSAGQPFAFISMPASGETLSGLELIQATTSDPANTTRGLLYVDGQFITAELGSSLSYMLQTAFFTNGDHVIKVRFYHSGLGAYLEAVDTFHFDNSVLLVPGVTILSPLGGSVLSGEIQVVGESNDPDGTSHYRLFVDGTQMARNTFVPGPFTVNTTQFANGLHTLRLRAYSRFVRAWVEDQIQVTFDNPILPFFISAPANGATVSGMITIDVTDNPSDMMIYGRLYVDGRFRSFDFMRPFRFHFDTAGLPNGPHQFRASAFSLTQLRFLQHEVTLNVQN